MSVGQTHSKIKIRTSFAGNDNIVTRIRHATPLGPYPSADRPTCLIVGYLRAMAQVLIAIKFAYFIKCRATLV